MTCIELKLPVVETLLAVSLYTKVCNKSCRWQIFQSL